MTGQVKAEVSNLGSVSKVQNRRQAQGQGRQNSQKSKAVLNRYRMAGRHKRHKR
jgi:hypothetical protein